MTITANKARTRAIAHYAKNGGNPADGETLLNELLTTVSASNLPYALAYNGFASERNAENVADRLLGA